MKKLSIILMSFLICSCASMVAIASGFKQEDSAYRIVPKTPGENRAQAIYYSPEFLRAKEEKKAETEMREPNYNRVSQFGYISVRIMGWTADTANPKNWLFIVQDKNKQEIYRERGSNSIPRGNINDLGSYYNTTWTNFHIINLKSAVEFPLFLRVINFEGKAIDITIEKK
jgi:hypothetical protein